MKSGWIVLTNGWASFRGAVNQRFTVLAEWFRMAVGSLEHLAGFLAFFVAWIGLGFLMRFSDSWQLVANTPTTLAEYLFSIIIARSSFMAEQKSDAALEEIRAASLRIMALEESLAQTLAIVRALVEREETEIEDLLAALQKAGYTIAPVN